MGARLTTALVASATLLLACGRDAPTRAPSASRTAERIAQAVAAGGARSGCDRPASTGPPGALITVTARQCLSCLHVGPLLRDAERDARRTRADLRVAARQDEAQEVCEFVRREKVRLPVVLVPDDAIPRADSTRAGNLLYVQLKPDATVALVRSAPTGPQLLQQIRGSTPEPSP